MNMDWKGLADDMILLETLKNDEISHKEDSLKRFDKLSFLLKIWGNIVEIGSRTAVLISYKI